MTIIFAILSFSSFILAGSIFIPIEWQEPHMDYSLSEEKICRFLQVPNSSSLDTRSIISPFGQITSFYSTIDRNIISIP
jgi:hypothetical protein